MLDDTRCRARWLGGLSGCPASPVAIQKKKPKRADLGKKTTNSDSAANAELEEYISEYGLSDGSGQSTGLRIRNLFRRPERRRMALTAC
jgi:hypothetical protein